MPNINMDLNKVPKQFCELVVGGFSKEFFIMAMLSGGAANTYALTPQHAKRLSQWLAHTVASYEKQHGKIEAEWTPGMKSPIQSGDLSEGDNTGGTGGKGKK